MAVKKLYRRCLLCHTGYSKSYTDWDCLLNNIDKCDKLYAGNTTDFYTLYNKFQPVTDPTLATSMNFGPSNQLKCAFCQTGYANAYNRLSCIKYDPVDVDEQRCETWQI